MLQKRAEKTADSPSLNQSANLRFKILHIVCYSERVSTKFAWDAFSM